MSSPLTRTLVRRVAGAAALATATGLLAAPALQAQAAPAAALRAAPTALSIGHVQRVGPDGSVDVVRGRLHVGRLGLGHRRVVLFSRTAGADGWTREGAHKTGRRGVVRFRVDPAETTAYRLAFLGTPRLQASRSAAVRVPVRPDIAITADPGSVALGGTATIAGTVTLQGSPLAEAKVRLWAVKVGHPRSAAVIARDLTDADGLVAFDVTPEVTTRYRLIVSRSDASAGAASAKVRVVVESPAT